MEIVLESGEVIEVGEGPDDLARAVAEHFLASHQIKSWERRKAIAGKTIEALQEERVSAYVQDAWTIAAKKNAPARGARLDAGALLKEELTRDDLLTLVSAAKGFDIVAIDPGLKGNDKEKWRPRTPLGALVKEYLDVVQVRSAFITTELATVFAEDK